MPLLNPTTKYSKFYPWARDLLFPTEKEGLAKYSKGKEIVVEIGVFEGASACIFKKNMNPFGHLYLIDPFISDSMNENLKARKWVAHLNVFCTWTYQSPKIVWLETKSTQIPKPIFLFFKKIDPIDFLFIDGDHSEKGTFEDWEFYSPLVKTGGLIALHDSRDFSYKYSSAKGHIGPKKLKQKLLTEYKDYLFLDEFGTITIFKKL